MSFIIVWREIIFARRIKLQSLCTMKKGAKGLRERAGSIPLCLYAEVQIAARLQQGVIL